MRDRVNAMFSPCVSYTEKDGVFTPYTDHDRTLIQNLGLPEQFTEKEYDAVLKQASENGHFLETMTPDDDDFDDDDDFNDGDFGMDDYDYDPDFEMPECESPEQSW